MAASGSQKFIVWVAKSEQALFKQVMGEENLTAVEKFPGRHEIQFTFSHSQTDVERFLAIFNERNSL
ncbi:MAG: hypothetical protein JWN25_43 [Verrucomicrobiales bacterium]|nr:hypothetical protein [Verrucomicrobiales bacterium]